MYIMSKIPPTSDNVNRKKSSLKYYRIPKEIFETPHLSLSAKMIYQYLYTIASNNNGYCTVKMQTIADKINIDRVWIIEKIEDLRKSGLIEIRKTGRANRYNIPAISGSLWQDVETTLFSDTMSTQSTSDVNSVNIRCKESQHQMSTQSTSNLKYIDKINTSVCKSSHSNNLSDMIPKSILEKYNTHTPLTGDNKKALPAFAKYLDLTDTDQQLILNANGIEKNILSDVLTEIKRSSNVLQSMSLLWIIKRIDKVLSGSYRDFNRKT